MTNTAIKGLVLQPGEALRIENGSGLLLAVHSGSVWLTQEGDRRDIMLGAGRWGIHIMRGRIAAAACARSPLCQAHRASVACVVAAHASRERGHRATSCFDRRKTLDHAPGRDGGGVAGVGSA
jgi:Protein of unknown function (DUF2917)